MFVRGRTFSKLKACVFITFQFISTTWSRINGLELLGALEGNGQTRIRGDLYDLQFQPVAFIDIRNAPGVSVSASAYGRLAMRGRQGWRAFIHGCLGSWFSIMARLYLSCGWEVTGNNYIPQLYALF
ncbi:hypothetical protein RHMOL_Rhmol13G0088300 [Rhododendron molle]|uniref:Uncharacterized protein n=1 Tax=Rhododendron molle TaxID=49168 RepID=A0ACC0L4I8_RHOML|nr:hypothetical protein RHMOL_Rhmol13G0088300 [Rhododendron molle]